MHSSKSWRKNAAQNIVRAGWRVLLRRRRRGCHCFDDDAFDKSGGILKLSLTFKLDDTQHLKIPYTSYIGRVYTYDEVTLLCLLLI